MFKWFNKKKKDNKGFTLVELVVVVAILAILVGLLAPQYTKYVEKSRKSADASNLDSLVTGFKVAASDVDYNNLTAGEYTIVIDSTGTTITPPKDADECWVTALEEYTGYNFLNKVESLKLKSNKWTGQKTTPTIAGKGNIGASVKIEDNGAVTVTYDPASVVDQGNENGNKKSK